MAKEKQTVSEACRHLAKRRLGKAVHPLALNRLYELWPEAHVQVSHVTSQLGGPQWTSVWIWQRYGESKPAGECIVRHANVHPHDQRNRRYGISPAFRRALREVSRRHKLNRSI